MENFFQLHLENVWGNQSIPENLQRILAQQGGQKTKHCITAHHLFLAFKFCLSTERGVTQRDEDLNSASEYTSIFSCLIVY